MRPDYWGKTMTEQKTLFEKPDPDDYPFWREVERQQRQAERENRESFIESMRRCKVEIDRKRNEKKKPGELELHPALNH